MYFVLQNNDSVVKKLCRGDEQGKVPFVHVMFSGQGKKRGEKPVFEIATLYPAEFVIKCLARLRREPSIKALLKEVTDEFPDGITQQNVIIGNKRNKSLLRVVENYFTDSVLKLRHGDEKSNSKALRAAYAIVATERDCQGSFGAKVFHASKLLGHFTKEIKDDRDLVSLGVSSGYSDFYISKPVPFPTIPEKEKPVQVRVTPADYEEIRKLQDFWKLPNQQSVVSRLIERQEKNVELGRQLHEKSNQLQELKAKINQLEKKVKINQLENKAEMSQVQTQPQKVTVTPAELEAMIERMVSEKVQQALASHPVNRQASQTKPTTQALVKPQEVIDWAGMSKLICGLLRSREHLRRRYAEVMRRSRSITTR